MDNRDPLRIGIAGLGVVGGSVVRMIQGNEALIAQRAGRAIHLAAVCARDRNRDRGFSTDTVIWFDDPAAMARSGEIDVFVELIGGEGGIALDASRVALSSGHHVVTANKAMLAGHGGTLAELAESSGVALGFEAAVAGGIPIVKTLRESLAGNAISRVYGILNGTCNYILSQMESEGSTFADCLKRAQALGYAEADPTFDVEGIDTAHKLVILTCLAFGTQIAKDEIFIEGISSIEPEDIAAAEELGYRIRLLGVAQVTDTGIEQRVHPTMVPKDSQIARINGVTNAVAVDGDFVGSIVLSGPGAGGEATASAVVGDLVDIGRGATGFPLGRPAASLVPYQRARMRAHQGGYYLRLHVPDRPGGFATIATYMADAGISLESIVQREGRSRLAGDQAETSFRTVTIITHDTTELAVRDALERIVNEGVVAGRPQMIRIERH
ncbi:MAG: homoserine dehydrogenase [Alphaproteobacteria bacterium]